MKTRKNVYIKTVEIIFQHFIPCLTQISKNHGEERGAERKKCRQKQEIEKASSIFSLGFLWYIRQSLVLGGCHALSPAWSPRPAHVSAR
jgi:hypothetical protein